MSDAIVFYEWNYASWCKTEWFVCGLVDFGDEYRGNVGHLISSDGYEDSDPGTNVIFAKEFVTEIIWIDNG